MATTSQALCQGRDDAEQPLQQQQQDQQDQPLPSASQIQPLQNGPEPGDTEADAAAAAPLASQQPMAAAMGPRKVNPAAFGGRHSPRAKREGIVHVNSTHNNTHLVLTDRDSKVETWVSGGTVGYKNANKASGAGWWRPADGCSSPSFSPAVLWHGRGYGLHARTSALLRRTRTGDEKQQC